MELQIFYRKPFPVQAIRVTAENLSEVATWCSGEVKQTSPRPGSAVKTYVKVDVINPRNIKQTMAFPGDWVLAAGASFKVYSDKAFHDTFDESHAPGAEWDIDANRPAGEVKYGPEHDYETLKLKARI